VATCREAAPLLARRAFDLVILDHAGLACDGGVISQAVADRGCPVPTIMLYTASSKVASALPPALVAHITSEADERSLRQAVLDELRCREDQLAMRFKKSA
jgi:DNA-binding NtrC family response regulator